LTIADLSAPDLNSVAANRAHPPVAAFERVNTTPPAAAREGRGMGTAYLKTRERWINCAASASMSFAGL
jgi:hypothetical protein